MAASSRLVLPATLALVVVASGCLGEAASPLSTHGSLPFSQTRCHLHAARTLAVRTAHYRLLIGLSAGRQIAPGGPASEAPAGVGSAVGSEAHLDLAVCSSTGQVRRVASPPVVRLTAPGIASITLSLRAMRPRGELEPAHFGANLTMLAFEPVAATVEVDGEHASVPLAPVSR